MSIVTREQLAAFHATHYVVERVGAPFVMRTGCYCPELQHVHGAHGVGCSAFLTAWNPLGQLTDGVHNATAQETLRRDLAALHIPLISGVGRDPATGWEERSLLGVGLPRATAIEFGNRYAQLAIIVAGADAVPELVLLR